MDTERGIVPFRGNNNPPWSLMCSSISEKDVWFTFNRVNCYADSPYPYRQVHSVTFKQPQARHGVRNQSRLKKLLLCTDQYKTTFHNIPSWIECVRMLATCSYWRVTVICLAKFFMNSNKIRNAFNIHVREMTEAMENRGRCSSCGRLLLLLSLALSSINANCDLQKKYK